MLEFAALGAGARDKAEHQRRESAADAGSLAQDGVRARPNWNLGSDLLSDGMLRDPVPRGATVRPPIVRLLIASQNAKKRRELELLLAPLSIEIVAPADVGGIPEVDEDQPTFAGNAAKKAASAARASKLWALADDSGLEVDALDGAPGVRSARYAGEPADDARNNAKLLAELAGLPRERRGARFVCALALARPDGEIALEVSGEAHGRILHAPRGSGDFGYDPLFLFTEPGFPQSGRGFAELTSPEKSGVSHRGRALRALAERLGSILGARGEP